MAGAKLLEDEVSYAKWVMPKRYLFLLNWLCLKTEIKPGGIYLWSILTHRNQD